MEFTFWFWLWLVLGAVFAVLELATTGLFMLPFAVGGFAAALIALAGASPGWQILGYFAISALAFVALRLYVTRWQNAPVSATGGNRLIGRPGVVTEEIDDARGVGMVRVDREVWRADAPGAGRVPIDTPIVVVAVEGTHVIVRPDRAEAQEL